MKILLNMRIFWGHFQIFSNFTILFWYFFEFPNIKKNCGKLEYPAIFTNFFKFGNFFSSIDWQPWVVLDYSSSFSSSDDDDDDDDDHLWLKNVSQILLKTTKTNIPIFAPCLSNPFEVNFWLATSVHQYHSTFLVYRHYFFTFPFSRSWIANVRALSPDKGIFCSQQIIIIIFFF